jgi:hypothetical protein
LQTLFDDEFLAHWVRMGSARFRPPPCRGRRNRLKSLISMVGAHGLVDPLIKSQARAGRFPLCDARGALAVSGPCQAME